MKKTKKLMQKILLAGCICMLSAGCAGSQKTIRKYAEGKELCELNTDDVTKLTYNEQEYTILDETVEKTDLGKWVGYIRQYVVADEDGNILLQENVDELSPWTITKLGMIKSTPTYVITFLNIYENSKNNEDIIVDVNGEYHKATMHISEKDTDIVFDFQVQRENSGNDFELNPEDATQLLCAETVYQVTSETVAEGQLGKTLDFLAQSITYDVETKRPLSKKELNKMDWAGTSSQKRDQRIYMEVREIVGVDSNETVAVKVDREYLIAKRQ